MSIRIINLISSTYKSVKHLNLYQTKIIDEETIKQQRLFTRIYILLFTSVLSVLLFYTAIIERNVSKTIVTPTITEYENLLNIYSNDVNCPCTFISIPYKEFVTDLHVTEFHQACTTDVVGMALKAGESPTFF